MVATPPRSATRATAPAAARVACASKVLRQTLAAPGVARVPPASPARRAPRASASLQRATAASTTTATARTVRVLRHVAGAGAACEFCSAGAAACVAHSCQAQACSATYPSGNCPSGQLCSGGNCETNASALWPLEPNWDLHRGPDVRERELPDRQRKLQSVEPQRRLSQRPDLRQWQLPSALLKHMLRGRPHAMRGLFRADLRRRRELGVCPGAGVGACPVDTAIERRRTAPPEQSVQFPRGHGFTGAHRSLAQWTLEAALRGARRPPAVLASTATPRRSAARVGNPMPSSGCDAVLGSFVQSCAPDANGCLTWSAATTCGGGYCDSAQSKCVACSDTCAPEGATQCAGKQVRMCQADAHGCLAWGLRQHARADTATRARMRAPLATTPARPPGRQSARARSFRPALPTRTDVWRGVLLRLVRVGTRDSAQNKCVTCITVAP